MGLPGIAVEDVNDSNSEAAVWFLGAWVCDGAAEARRYLAEHVEPFGVSPILARPGHPGRATPERLTTLTGRERQILSLVAAGMSNDEIADDLVVSPATVKTHVNRAMTKLGARDWAQLVVLAYQTGLVRIRNQSNR